MSTPDYSWIHDMKGKLKSGIKEEPAIKLIESVAETGEQPFAALSFVRADRKNFVGEAAKKGSDIIFHFFPASTFPEGFKEKMGDAFIEVFKFPEMIEAAYSEELQSWAVRVRGFSTNPNVELLIGKLFEALDGKLK